MTNSIHRVSVVAVAVCAFSAGAAQTAPPAGWLAHPPVHIHNNATSAAPRGYTPAQMRRAYGFDSISGDGTGQTIAVVDAYGSPSVQADLDVFSGTFGLPSASVQVVYATSKPKRVDGGWALETSLDVQWVHAIAPGARILLVVAKTASFSDLLAGVDKAVKLGAHVVSMSWGGSEFSSEPNYDGHFSTPGVTFFASSGDSGTGASWPASSPRVVSVGGTTLQLDSSGNVLSETAWSGSGGGVSRYEPQPAYQYQFPIPLQSSWRGIPDVSYNADPATGVPVYMSTKYQGMSGWFKLGGTSAGAPQWAALMALVNEGRSMPLNAADAELYALGGAGFGGSYLRDIVSGCNASNPSAPLTCAAESYDYVTGVGSPVASTLVPALMTARAAL